MPERGTGTIDEVADYIESQYQVGQDQLGRPFLVPREGPLIARMLSDAGNRLCQEIAAGYRRERQHIIRRSVITEALNSIAGDALLETQSVLELRCQVRPTGTLLVDLGDASGKAIQVRNGSWKVVTPRRPHFYRSALTAALPEPRRGGTIDDLRQFLNVSNRDWPLLVAWIMAAYDPSIPRLIAYFDGPPRTGKTTTTRFLGRLIDPKNAEDWASPRAARAWPRAASAAYLLPLDNLSQLTREFSDMLCGTTTGQTFVEAQHYDNTGLVSLSFRRLVTITTTGIAGIRGDLARRLLRIETVPFTDERDSADLHRNFDGWRPQLLGAIFDTLAAVRAALATVEVPTGTPDKEFARYLAATVSVLGLDSSAMLQLTSNGVEIARAVVDGSELLSSVVKLVEEKSVVELSASRLLSKLISRRPSRTSREADEAWPSNPEQLASQLKTGRGQLLLLGVRVTQQGRTSAGRRWLLEWVHD